jgi:hypothetical protein
MAKLTWKNGTAAQNLTWYWVNSNLGLNVGTNISPGDSHTEDLGEMKPAAMGFGGNWNGYQLVFFPTTAAGDATAYAGDGTPSDAGNKAWREIL